MLKKLSATREEAEEQTRCIADAKAALVHIQLREEELEENIHNVKRKKAEHQKCAEDSHATTYGPQSLDIMGCCSREEKELQGAEAHCLQHIQNIRSLMEAGKVEQARAEEFALANLINSDDYEGCLPDPSYLSKPGYEAQRAQFVRPFSLCCSSSDDDDEFERTLQYARENPTSVLRSQMSVGSSIKFAMSMSGYAHKFREEVPDGIHAEILNEIRCFACLLEEAFDGHLFPDGEEEDSSDEENDEDDADEENSRMDVLWTALGDAVRKHQEIKQKYNQLQLQLPSEKSAPIARFNTDAHFLFSSPKACEETPPLTQALTRCELKEVPTDNKCNRDDGKCTTKVYVRRPIVYSNMLDNENEGDLYGNDVFSMDVEEDVMAVFGNQEITWMDIPLTENTETTEGSLKPSSLCKVEKKCCFSTGGVADAARKLAWASTCSGTVRAYSSENNRSQVALLAFDEREIEAERRLLGGKKFNICRVRDSIVGTGATSRLSVWNIQQALDQYKVADSTKGVTPYLVSVEDESTGFRCGDIQWLGGSSLLVGPEQEEFRDGLSLRLFDLETEKVTGLFCGYKGSISIEKQHCREAFDAIFAADSHASYVYDVRTFQPCITLQTNHIDGQVLGVPGEAAMAAFAFCHRDQEEIQCWDLRMPTSHAYSMWTGNNDISSLCWHGPSASLLAGTSSSHGVKYGINGCYRYGDRFDDDDEEEDTSWPKQAVHDPGYFGDQDVCYHYDYRSIIRYQFDTGSIGTSNDLKHVASS